MRLRVSEPRAQNPSPGPSPRGRGVTVAERERRGEGFNGRPQSPLSLWGRGRGRGSSIALLRLLAGCFMALILCIAAGPAHAQSPNLPSSGLLQLVTKNVGLEGRVLWMDGTANLDRLRTRAGVAAVMEK